MLELNDVSLILSIMSVIFGVIVILMGVYKKFWITIISGILPLSIGVIVHLDAAVLSQINYYLISLFMLGVISLAVFLISKTPR